jgi:NADH-ubiquinone oxidoreductase chain 5
VALSTLSQLGLIIITLRIGIKTIAFFHILTHAIFKSTLFITAGVAIHMSNGAQDTRFIRSMLHRSPLLIAIFSFINLSLLGFPFLSGFYSKDLVIELTLQRLKNKLLLILILLAVGMTVAYSLRVVFIAITSASNSQRGSSLHDLSTPVIVSMSFVFLIGILMGYFFSWLYLWIPHAVTLSPLIKYRVLITIAIRSSVTFLIANRQKKIRAINKDYNILINRSRKIWFLPFLSTKQAANATIVVGSTSSELLDKGWLESYPPQKRALTLARLSQLAQKGQNTALVRAYLVTVVSILLLVLFIYLHSLHRAL